MTFQQFMALQEVERIKAMRRALKASSNLENKKNMPTIKEMEILNHSIRWLGGYNIIQSYEKRVLKKSK